MANMSSFYGGRSGASFVIVKRFDGINLSANTYTKTYYAVEEKSNNIIFKEKDAWKSNGEAEENLVKVTYNNATRYVLKKSKDNFAKYNWKLFINNGSTFGSITLPTILAESMIELFAKGVESTDIVNYQEYVLIDTVTNLNEYSNPDNGKIYRRGFDINNGMYGAEYIGKITGPQGFNTGIQLDTFSNINSDTSNQKVKGAVTADLLPGSNLEIENNQLKEGQGIECIYANILDEGGNVLQTKIGFKFPYLVNTFKGKLVTPYDVTENENLITEIKENGETLQNSTDNPNPFYRHWSIKIPQGVKGDSVEEIRIQPTIIPANTPYYDNLETLKADIEANNDYLNKSGLIAEESNILSDTYDKSNYCIVLNEGTETEPIYKYIDAKLCTNKKVFYTIRDYDSLEEGSVSIPFEVGDIDSIIKTDLAEDGTLTIYYDNGKTETARNNIRWVNNLQVNSIGDNRNYKLHVSYNTPKSNGETTEEDIGESISYIKDLKLNNSNQKLRVTYNIKDGTLNKEEDIGESISYIKNLQVNTDGDQKLYATYNIKDGTLNKKEAISEPINYIKEMYISNAKDSESTSSVNVSSKHLFIKYSDPNKQNTGVTIVNKGSGWTDLGSIEPPAANIQILAGVESINELIDGIPPEVLFSDIKYRGCIVPTNDTNFLYYYDYKNERWVVIGSLNEGSAADKINYIGSVSPNVDDMYVNSLWFEVTKKEL